MIRIITSLAAVLTVGSIQANTLVTEPPKLVVGITIDQLRGDYLQLFQNAFSERGFKRLLNGGLVYQNMSFDFNNVNATSAIASIYTGSTPSVHGIVSDKKYLIDKNQEISIFSDDDFIGNSTSDKVSPRALKASTITDELKIASQGRSTVYSFAPNLSESLITSSHTGNCAFWIEDNSGQWASSTFYKDFYWAVDQANRSYDSYSIKAWGMAWGPLLTEDRYVKLPYNRSYQFLQKFGSDKDTYKLFKQSPIVNESVTNMSMTVLDKAGIGKRENPDFLSLTYYAGNYNNLSDYSFEMQDAYIRLDKEIEKVLDAIEAKVGLNNTLIFLTSTGYFDSNIEIEEDGIASTRGTFYSNRCEALLNMYLMAIYGRDGQWVEKYYDGQIYLNRKLIKDKEVSLQEIQSKAADFVSEFTGVQEVYTLYDIKYEKWNPRLESFRNGINKEIAGDLFVIVQPGITIVDEQYPAAKTKDNRYNAIISPVIFFGNNIKPQKIKRTIKATEIAPSVARILRIRSPNAATEQALSELF